MAENKTITYSCDKCGRKCRRSENSHVAHSVSEGVVWRRLHIKISLRSGVHNDAKEEPADLCKRCAISLLREAINGIRYGVDENYYPLMEKSNAPRQ